MNPQESSEAKDLWKMFYATESFKRARQSAEHILENKLEKDDPLFHPLMVATYVLYAKPFTNAKGVGRIPEDIVPKQHLDFHRLMIEHRNQVYAHRDADGFEIADYGTVNQVRALQTGNMLYMVATEFHARYPAMPQVIELCTILEEKTKYHSDKLWKKYHTQVPKQVGEFVLNVIEEKDPMWIPHTKSILG